MSTTFITGGFGFLGQYIVRAIRVHDPHGELRVLTRTQRKTFLDLQKLERVQWTRGELTQPESFAGHLAGVDTVIHNAAMVSFVKADAQKVFDANVIGTRNLAQAARKAGCKNFIFISSISAVEFRPPQITDETFVPDLEYKKKYDIYGYTKRLSEIELAEMKDDMRVIMLNPSVILGPGSERVQAAINAIKKFPILPMMDYVNAFVDVRDVARAVILALTKGRSGERYIVSAHNASMIQFTRAVVEALEKNTRVLRLSPSGLKLADGLVALLDALNLNPGLRRPSQMNIDKPCSHEKIKVEMGWEPGFTLEESIRDSVIGNSMTDLKNKTVLITGAARGLGYQLALLLDGEGCSMILVDRDEISFANVQTCHCDLGDLSQRKKLIETLRARKIDILVNCAGIGSHSQLSQLTVDEIERVMQVNTLAPLELIAGLSPLELIVNIGSVAGEMNLPSMGLYAASKTSVHAYTRSIRLEGAKTLLVILGPLRGTDFTQAIAHPRTGQPNWYRQLDLPAEAAARLIVRAMKRGQSQLVAPWWYRIVFVFARVFAPLIGMFGR